MPYLDVQLRTEGGALLSARSVGEAMKMAKENPSIWKISWTESITDERIRLVKQITLSGELWLYDPIVV